MSVGVRSLNPPDGLPLKQMRAPPPVGFHPEKGWFCVCSESCAEGLFFCPLQNRPCHQLVPRRRGWGSCLDPQSAVHPLITRACFFFRPLCHASKRSFDLELDFFGNVPSLRLSLSTTRWVAGAGRVLATTMVLTDSMMAGRYPSVEIVDRRRPFVAKTIFIRRPSPAAPFFPRRASGALFFPHDLDLAW